MSRRDGAIVAWHEARSAWKNATQKSRPVGYGVTDYEGRRRGGLGQGAKHVLVPGYDQAVPLGQNPCSPRSFVPEEFLRSLRAKLPASLICEICAILPRRISGLWFISYLGF